MLIGQLGNPGALYSMEFRGEKPCKIFHGDSMGFRVKYSIVFFGI